MELVRFIPTGKLYVLKTFDKEKIMTNGVKMDQVLAERDILKTISDVHDDPDFGMGCP